MLDLFLTPPTGGRRRLDLFPSTSLCIRRNSLQYHPDSPPLVHLGRRWHIKDDTFHCIRIDSLVTVRFDRSGELSRSYGPLKPVLIANGTLYIDRDERPLARLVDDDHWLEMKTGQRWTEVLVAEVMNLDGAAVGEPVGERDSRSDGDSLSKQAAPASRMVWAKSSSSLLAE